MSVQITYGAKHAIGYEGSIVDMSLKNIVTKIAEGDVKAGRAVVRGTGDNGALLPSETGQEFVGITVATTAGQADCDDEFAYLENSAMNVLNNGLIYEICEDGCVPGDTVFFRHTVGTGTEIGAFRTDADTATADEIVGATWESTATAGNIAKIKLV